ncbi:hypothetical protein BOTBODRAFT_46171 [Botryobasidium botryosum FD-172 SS1]|uniref:Uncharacterized protein n=1 Tax=Botryobasidium botryosum (strain FD-172 SS1) TaxID=930990 RepID=A0A067M830_BOTB1|nr:hypothetical protein BOTBODRAFT_46171 [Botryobasidium botryosum FD-172 SS1]
MPELFTEWCTFASVHVHHKDDNPDPAREESIRQLLDATAALPAWVRDKDSKYYQPARLQHDELRSLQRELASYACRPDQLLLPNVSPEDSLALARALPTVLKTCYLLNMIDGAQTSLMEPAWRMPCNALLSEAFTFGQNTSYRLKYLPECTITLPNTEPRFPAATTASGCLFLCQTSLSKDNAPENITAAKESTCFNFQWPHLYILQFACEYKLEEGSEVRNQLTMDLAVAQYQRRSLGILGHVVYGACAARGVVRIYASWWYKNNIKIIELMSLDLKRPDCAVRFFMFLRMVLSQTRLNQSEFEELSEEKLRAAQATYSGSWKSPPAADDDDLCDTSSDESSGGDSDDDDA